MACVEDLARLDINFEDYISDEANLNKIFDVKCILNQESLNFKATVIQRVNNADQTLITLNQQNIQVMPGHVKQIIQTTAPYILKADIM